MKVTAEYELDLSKFRNDIAEVKKSVGGIEDKVTKSATGMGSAFGKIADTAATIFSVDKAMQFVGALVSATSQSQKFAAVLANTLGSQGAGQKALGELSNWAKQMPGDLAGLTEVFIKLVNRGFKPTQVEMTKLGDLAASQGKDLNQLAEAVLDAQTGEYERLKEFGVKASRANGEVTLSFKGQTTVVKDNEEAVRNAILAFGAMNGVAGSMAVQMETTGGKISNLEDGFSQLLATLGNNASPEFNAVIDLFGGLVGGINETLTGLTPLADGLRETQVQMNYELEALKNGNLSMDQRKILIEQVNVKYADYLPNLLTEKSSLEEITIAQKEANDELSKRIVLSAKQETQTAILKKQADEVKRQAELYVLLEKSKSATNTQQKVGEALDAIAGTTASTKGIQDRIKESQNRVTGLTKQLDQLNTGFNKVLNDMGVENGATETDKEKAVREKKEKEDLQRKKDAASKLSAVDKKEQEKAAKEKLAASRELTKQEIAAIQDENSRKAADIKFKAQIEIEDYKGNPIQKQAFADNVNKELQQNLKALEITKIPVGIDALDAENKDRMDAINAQAKKEGDVIHGLVEANEEAEKRKTKTIEEENEIRNKLTQERLGQTQEIGNLLFDFNKTLQDAELANLQDQKDKGVLTEDEYARKVAAIKRKQAIADKEQAIFNIGLSTAQAIIAALAMIPPNPALAVFSGVVGAIQLATVLAKPIPAFEKGGKINGKEQLIRVNEKGEEFIANAQASRKHAEELEAMNKGGLHYDKLLYKKYIAPAMKANQSSTYGKGKQFVFDDSGIRHDLKKIELGPRTIKALKPAMPTFKNKNF